MNIDNSLLRVLMDEITTDDVLKRNIVQQVIYKEAALISVGTQLLGETSTAELDMKFDFPSEMSAEGPIPENAIATIAPPITWTPFTLTLDKYEVRYAVNDWSKLRELNNYQMEFTRRRASEALATAKDTEILTDLLAGITNTVTVPAGSEWDKDATSTNIEKDIVDAWDSVARYSNVTMAEMRNCFLIVPARVYGKLLQLDLINNVQQRAADYLQQAYGLTIYPTRSTLFADCALFGIKGPQTASHFVLQTNAIPMVEEQRIYGRAWEYRISQWFGTKVVPESTSVTTSYRLVKIDNVVA
jgi:hypothetical protein